MLSQSEFETKFSPVALEGLDAGVEVEGVVVGVAEDEGAGFFVLIRIYNMAF